MITMDDLNTTTEQLLYEHNEIMRRIADSLDALVITQDTMVQTLDEVVNVVEEIASNTEPPVVVRGEYQLPGFDGDPLAKFPSIRKEEK